MDKQEYKLRAEEIKSLISKRDFFGAAKLADGIDWTRVRSVAMLCTVSDLYKAIRRYRESKELLLMAYERQPSGRTILYSLCELCIKMGEVVQAEEYYKEFVKVAPMDNGKYVLQYKLYVALEASLEERIAILEELKKRDNREKWRYELAFLYHRIGLSTKCVEECDELILWFRDGRYVKKAMELKMLHQPLTESQEADYNAFVGKNAELPEPEPIEDRPIEEQIKEPSVNVGQYDTLNLQRALAESMKEVLSPAVGDFVMQNQEKEANEDALEITSVAGDTDDMKEIFFDDKTGEVVVPASGVEEIVLEEVVLEDTEPTTAKQEEIPVAKKETAVKQQAEKSEKISVTESTTIEIPQKSGMTLSGVPYEVPGDATKEIPSIREIMGRSLAAVETEKVVVSSKKEYTEDGIPTNMVDMLVQEYDGQISLVVEEGKKVERQITGQMNIVEVLEEWEKTKKEYEAKSKAERTKKVLEQTGSMFTEFEAKARDGVLEQLEKEHDRETEKGDFILEETVKESELIKEAESQMKVLTEEELEMAEEAEEQETVSAAEEVVEEKRTYTNLEDTAALEKLILEEEEEAARKEKEAKEASGKSLSPDETIQKIREAQEEIRELSEEEKALFAPFIQTKGARRRFMKALDLISLAAYTGNVIVTGEADSDTIKLAKNIMKDIQMTDANFSGVIAKVSGTSLNSKSVESTVEKLNNGGLIIEKASGMNSQAVAKLLKALNQEKTGIVVILEDNKKAMKRMLAAYPAMSTFFNSRVEVEQLNNDALAAYGKQYAAHLEYAIDELGMLALQTQIEDRQTSDHIVTVAEVRELVDDAIYNVNRKNLGHLLDSVMGKRYDDNDMIILREKDFI